MKPRTAAATTPNEAPRAVGLSQKEWARLAGVGYSSLFAYPSDRKPKSVRVGRRVIVVESPEDWLARMGATDGEPAKQAA